MPDNVVHTLRRPDDHRPRLGIAIWASADLLSAGLGFTATLGAAQGLSLSRHAQSGPR